MPACIVLLHKIFNILLKLWFSNCWWHLRLVCSLHCQIYMTIFCGFDRTFFSVCVSFISCMQGRANLFTNAFVWSGFLFTKFVARYFVCVMQDMHKVIQIHDFCVSHRFLLAFRTGEKRVVFGLVWVDGICMIRHFESLLWRCVWVSRRKLEFECLAVFCSPFGTYWHLLSVV